MNIPEVKIDQEENHSLHIVGKEGGYVVAIATVYCDPLEEQSYKYASLIEEAFNVTHSTGKTPKELAELNKALVDELKASQQDFIEMSLKAKDHLDFSKEMERNAYNASVSNALLIGKNTVLTERVKQLEAENKTFGKLADGLLNK